MKSLAILALLAAAAGMEAYPRKAAAKSTKPGVTFDVASINAPNQPELSPGDKGAGVARAQILLARAHYSSGEIDGYFGVNLRRALGAWQDERQLPPSARIDA